MCTDAPQMSGCTVQEELWTIWNEQEFTNDWESNYEKTISSTAVCFVNGIGGDGGSITAHHLDAHLTAMV